MPVKVKEGEPDDEEAHKQEENDEGDCNEGDQENSGDKASSALIPPKKGKLKRKTKVKEETPSVPESLYSDEKLPKGCLRLLLTGCIFFLCCLKNKNLIVFSCV